jgi:RNA polymerase subunit RPABC4/transcription elongation factor Spt4
MHVRVCRECGEEYRPDIAVCADCGAELTDRWEDERGRVVGADGTVAADEGAEPAEGVPMQALFAGPPGALRPLADALVAGGLPFELVPEDRVEYRRTEGARLFLVVPETEAKRALEALADYRGRGTELGFTELVQIWVGHDADPPCPACNAHVPPDAASCPDCGLELGGPDPS